MKAGLLCDLRWSQWDLQSPASSVFPHWPPGNPRLDHSVKTTVTEEKTSVNLSGIHRENLGLWNDHVCSFHLKESYSQLYRKKPGLAITFAKLPQNLDKNRYKDVLPCEYPA
ncbi:hypothetical protein P7K49_001523 [Saguinus oedipus]|uniref:Uncharacterized protein n=1 Tax=Saguinus oedipus TaxID=9490 RepID=A0ABQ9WEQ9_SAGOE|nr:hypothetical protein P7K49_001523 [Saguinus oedipus]